MVLRIEPVQIASYGLSDTGLVRKNNEDVWGSLPRYHLYVLADGMGGHQAGEVAAREATLFLLTELRLLFEKEKIDERSCDKAKELIGQAIVGTNHFVYKLSLTHELLGGMGTTMLCLYFHDDSVIYAHVGDSRIYRTRNGELVQLTHDHSLESELVDIGKISKWQCSDSQVKGIITKAIGTDPVVEPTIEVAKVLSGDLYLLCSDGLTDLVKFEEIKQVLNGPLTVEEKVRSLIASAKRKGGHDNVTAVCVEVKDEKDLSRQ